MRGSRAHARPRVLLLGDTLALGGTEGQFVEAACRLSRSRLDVTVACLRAVGPLRARLDAAGVPVLSLATRSVRGPAGVPALLALVRYLRRTGIDLVHAFDYYSNVRGVIAARVARRPAVIASQRDLGDLRSPRQARLQRLALRAADRVVVNSPSVADVVRDTADLPAFRVVLIPNGVDLKRFAVAHRPPAIGAGVALGTLANLRPEKGIAELIRATALVAEHHPEVRLAIWGDGPLRGELSALVHDLGLERVVTLHGRTETPEAALSGLSVFVLPSRSEASSNAILEAMATGLPIVTTTVGGNPWMVPDERCGLVVPPGDVAALSKALSRLVEDPLLALRLGTAGRSRVEEEFTLDQQISRLEGLYCDTVARRTVA